MWHVSVILSSISIKAPGPIPSRHRLVLEDQNSVGLSSLSMLLLFRSPPRHHDGQLRQEGHLECPEMVEIAECAVFFHLAEPSLVVRERANVRSLNRDWSVFLWCVSELVLLVSFRFDSLSSRVNPLRSINLA